MRLRAYLCEQVCAGERVRVDGKTVARTGSKARLSGGARRRRRRRPPTASRLKGPRKQKGFAYKLLKRGLANLMSPTSTSGVAPPLARLRALSVCKRERNAEIPYSTFFSNNLEQAPVTQLKYVPATSAAKHSKVPEQRSMMHNLQVRPYDLCNENIAMCKTLRGARTNRTREHSAMTVGWPSTWSIPAPRQPHMHRRRPSSGQRNRQSI
ncbi:hypothetical protein EVAR_45495_1 [Eumeta japonica]|uniref:Uncharacterized protein n=1 Tax=Eumeta variegata TaxID=151549 RepID=A0A4C1WGK6_EUMVA|nr:hypothetical protein EVAR_45495_1 [Eumeta japonica]